MHLLVFTWIFSKDKSDDDNDEYGGASVEDGKGVDSGIVDEGISHEVYPPKKRRISRHSRVSNLKPPPLPLNLSVLGFSQEVVLHNL